MQNTISSTGALTLHVLATGQLENRRFAWLVLAGTGDDSGKRGAFPNDTLGT